MTDQNIVTATSGQQRYHEILFPPQPPHRACKRGGDIARVKETHRPDRNTAGARFKAG